MRKALKLQHHKHTGKKLHHKHTSYRGITAVLVTAALSLLCVQQTHALDYDVSAKVSATIPPSAAIITSPTNGIVSSERNLVIEGTCPVISPAAIVIIMRNGIVASSTACTASGKFNTTISLDEGLNTLYTRIVNITDDYGPNGTSQSARLLLPDIDTYDGTQDTAGNCGDYEELSILMEDALVSFVPDKPFELAATIKDGCAPYNITVEWGDKSKDELEFPEAGKFTLAHTYKKRSAFRARVTVIDAADTKRSLEHSCNDSFCTIITVYRYQ